jgi:small neutral amino acid transporter SnatA (MarC family)
MGRNILRYSDRHATRLRRIRKSVIVGTTNKFYPGIVAGWTVGVNGTAKITVKEKSPNIATTLGFTINLLDATQTPLPVVIAPIAIPANSTPAAIAALIRVPVDADGGLAAVVGTVSGDASASAVNISVSNALFTMVSITAVLVTTSGGIVQPADV